MNAAPEVIILRHAPEDTEAAHQIRERLQPILTKFQVVAGEVDSNIAPAGNIAILTPAFPNERNIDSVNSTVPWIPFLYADCEWQQFKILAPDRMLPRAPEPFSQLGPARQTVVLAELAEACNREFAGAALDSASEYPEFREIIDEATALARSRRSHLTTSCLLFAVLERGRTNPTPVDAPQLLFSTVNIDRYAQTFKELFPDRATRDVAGGIIP